MNVCKISLEAKCPLYLRSSVEDRKNRTSTITCQWVQEGINAQLRFRRPADAEIHLKTFCCEKWQYCEIYRGLKSVEDD